MAKANWKLTLEFTSDDGEGGPHTTVISQTGDWNSQDHMRPPNECVAIDMSSMSAMLLECGRIVCGSDMQETIKAFGGR